MTSFAIKIIAIIAMTLDHIEKIITQPQMMALMPDIPFREAQRITAYILTTLGIIGRIAFPLFAFFIVEGTRKTRSMPRYIGRLFLFALISEPLYYFGFGINPTWEGLLKNLAKHRFTNVFFTLALGALMIWVFGLIEKKLPKFKWFIDIPVWLLFMFAAGMIDCDYSEFGVMLIGGLYLAKQKKFQMIVIVVWSFIIYILYQASFGYCWYALSLDSWLNMISASLSAVFVWLYNGERGPKFKWGFYIYYPAHIAALLFISSLINPISY